MRRPADRRLTGLVFAAAAALLVTPAVPEALPHAPVLLTGTLRAESAERLPAPITSTWNLKLEWLVEEGVRVEAGDVVARFDTSGLADQLIDAENRHVATKQQRDVQESQGRLQKLELELALARAEAEFRKATLDASVPEGILGGKDFRERQLNAATKKKEYEDALAALSTQETTHAAALIAADLELGRLQQQIDDRREELDALSLVATRAGIVVHEDHVWYGRKVREGDQVQATFPIVSIPDLSSIEVEAWASEVDVRRLERGQAVDVSLDAFPSRRFRGAIERIGSAGEPREAWGREPYFRVTISLADSDPDTMKPGMSARCVIVPGGPHAVASARETLE